MTELMPFLVLNIPSIICVLSGAYLATKDKEGWGWFLFVGLLLSRFPDIWNR